MNNHRGKASIYRGVTARSSRDRRSATPLREGQVRCEECQRGVRLRADGNMVGHRVDGYACLGGGTDRYMTEEV